MKSGGGPRRILFTRPYDVGLTICITSMSQKYKKGDCDFFMVDDNIHISKKRLSLKVATTFHFDLFESLINIIQRSFIFRLVISFVRLNLHYNQIVVYYSCGAVESA